MRNLKIVKIGNLSLDGTKIFIQSMLNIPSNDIKGNVLQAINLERAGCDILRVAIPDIASINLIEAIKKEISIPLVADIHFDYKLAIEAAVAGIDKIRINPGNIGNIEKVNKVVKICKLKNIPIRIGVNSGSLEKKVLEKYGGITPEAMVESALNHVKILEECDFDDIVISLKSSNVEKMVKSYRILSEKCNYPLHLGVTEAGTEELGVVKSSIGIGSLLIDRIGETIRVSLTENPVREIIAAKNILKSLGLLGGIEIISCPTCGRTKIDLIKLTKDVSFALKDIDKNLKVAIMGCIVNGPGEAKDADIGIAGGDGCAVLFKNGKIIKKIPENNIIQTLLEEIDHI